jgi:hypothetical protein
MCARAKRCKNAVSSGGATAVLSDRIYSWTIFTVGSTFRCTNAWTKSCLNQELLGDSDANGGISHMLYFDFACNKLIAP